MKRKIVLAVIAAVLALSAAGCADSEKQVLNIYNWGEYVADGSEGACDVIRDFTDWYRREYDAEAVVNYSTYPSNEDMYNKNAYRNLPDDSLKYPNTLWETVKIS